MNNTFGISDKSYDLMIKALSSYDQLEEVLIFGSRAKGSYKHGSDIDLAVKGEGSSPQLALDIKSRLNEALPIPYHVDVVDYYSLKQPELKEHIDRVGKVIYMRKAP